jgi:hypothetical protein
MYRLHLQCRRIRERGTSVSRWLQTEPPVGNNQLYKNRERRRVAHREKTERRGVGTVVKVIPAGNRGRSISGRESVGVGFPGHGFFYSEDGEDTFLRNVG